MAKTKKKEENSKVEKDLTCTSKKDDVKKASEKTVENAVSTVNEDRDPLSHQVPKNPVSYYQLIDENRHYHNSDSKKKKKGSPDNQNNESESFASRMKALDKKYYRSILKKLTSNNIFSYTIDFYFGEIPWRSETSKLVKVYIQPSTIIDHWFISTQFYDEMLPGRKSSIECICNVEIGEPLIDMSCARFDRELLSKKEDLERRLFTLIFPNAAAAIKAFDAEQGFMNMVIAGNKFSYKIPKIRPDGIICNTGTNTTVFHKLNKRYWIMNNDDGSRNPPRVDDRTVRRTMECAGRIDITMVRGNSALKHKVVTLNMEEDSIFPF